MQKLIRMISAAVHNTSKENSTRFTPHLSFFIHGSRPARFVPSCMRTEHISVIVRLLATKKNDDEERQMLITSLIYYYSTIFRACNADIAFHSTRSSSLKIWMIRIFHLIVILHLNILSMRYTAPLNFAIIHRCFRSIVILLHSRDNSNSFS